MFTIARASRLIACLVSLLLISACSRSPAPPTTPPTDGRARVVALSPAIASIMRDLDQTRLIVGRHAHDAWSDPALPACGDQVAGIDYEQILRVRPTHVFLQMASAPEKLVRMGRERGFVVKNYTILSLDEIRLATRELWNWGGRPGDPGDYGMERAPLEDRMDAAWSRDPEIDAAKVGRVLLLAQVDPAGALGPGSWHHDILRRLGATPAIVEGSVFITMDAEDVLRLAPDAIILFAPRAPGTPAPPQHPDAAGVIAMLGALGELRIPAITNAKAALIDDPSCHLPSTAMIGVAEEMRRILRGWSE